MAKNRNIFKQLATMEDIAQGVGEVTQQRGGAPYVTHRMDVPFAVESEAEMQALNITQFTRTRVYSGTTTFEDYIFDPLATAGIAPTNGVGFWVLLAKVRDVVKYYDSIAGDIPDLVGIEDGQQISLKGWHVDSDQGGGTLYWDSTKAKSDHNGGTVFSPTVPFSNTSDYLDGVGEIDPSGFGCWVRPDSNKTGPEIFGAVGDGVIDDFQSWQAHLALGIRGVYGPTYYLGSAVSTDSDIFISAKEDRITLTLGFTGDIIISTALNIYINSVVVSHNSTLLHQTANFNEITIVDCDFTGATDTITNYFIFTEDGTTGNRLTINDNTLAKCTM